MSRYDEDPFGHEPDYTVRCAECGSLIGTDKTLTGPRVCVPCAVGEKPSRPVLFCPDCGNQRSRFDGEGCKACEWNRLDAEVEAQHGPNWFRKLPEVVNAE